MNFSNRPSAAAVRRRASTRVYPPTYDQSSQFQSSSSPKPESCDSLQDPSGVTAPNTHPLFPPGPSISLPQHVPGRTVIDLPPPPGPLQANPLQSLPSLDLDGLSTAPQNIENTEDQLTPKADDHNKQWVFPEVQPDIKGKENYSPTSQKQEQAPTASGGNDEENTRDDENLGAPKALGATDRTSEDVRVDDVEGISPLSNPRADLLSETPEAPFTSTVMPMVYHWNPNTGSTTTTNESSNINTKATSTIRFSSLRSQRKIESRTPISHQTPDTSSCSSIPANPSETLVAPGLWAPATAISVAPELLNELSDQVSAMQGTLASLPASFRDLKQAVERLERRSSESSIDVYDLFDDDNQDDDAKAEDGDQAKPAGGRCDNGVRRSSADKRTVRQVVCYIEECIEALADEVARMKKGFPGQAKNNASQAKETPGQANNTHVSQANETLQQDSEVSGLRQEVEGLRRGLERVESLIVLGGIQPHRRKSSLTYPSAPPSLTDELDRLRKENRSMRALLESSTRPSSYNSDESGNDDHSPKSKHKRKISWSEEVQVKEIEPKEHEYIDPKHLVDTLQRPADGLPEADCGSEGRVVQWMNGRESVEELKDDSHQHVQDVEPAEDDSQDSNDFHSATEGYDDDEAARNVESGSSPPISTSVPKICITDLPTAVDSTPQVSVTEVTDELYRMSFATLRPMFPEELVAREPMTRAEMQYRAWEHEEERQRQRERQEGSWLRRVVRAVFLQ